jgi:hypothetical protein
MGRGPRFAGRGLLVVGSIALVLGGTELGLRWIGSDAPLLHFGTPEVYRADSDLIYSRRPGAPHTNSLGLRDFEVDTRPGTFRVIALGDSYTFGFNVPPDASYPALLERELREGGRVGGAVDVVNAGIPGYNVDQAYRLFEERLGGLDPDWVILVIEPKDLAGANVLYDLDGDELVRVGAYRNWIYWQLILRSHTPAWLKASKLYGFVLGKLSGSDLLRTLPPGGLDAQIEWQIAKIERIVDRLVARGREEGFRVLVVNYPDRPALRAGGDYTRSTYFELPVQILGPRGNEHMAELLAMLERSGAEVIDGMQVFLERSRQRGDLEALYLGADPHMSRFGNRTFARMLVPTLEATVGPRRR